MKIIGVSPRLLVYENVEKEFVNSRYVKQLTQRNLNAVMISLDNPDVLSILTLCDAFLLTGGYDIDPKHFNEENHGKSVNCTPSLDKIDLDIVNYARDNKKPLLGICRGHQSINVFFGGTLYQDIGDTHRNIKEGHIVYTQNNRLLPFKKKIAVNSYHHQAICRVAPGFDIIAHAEDGIIEAMIHRELPIISVQWHPEAMAGSEESNIVFDAFLSLINEQKKD